MRPASTARSGIWSEAFHVLRYAIPSTENCEAPRSQEYRATPLNLRISSATPRDRRRPSPRRRPAGRRRPHGSSAPAARRASPFSPALPRWRTAGPASAPVELGPAGTAEVAQLGVIDAEAIVEVVHQLGDQEVEVGVALAVGVGGHVDRHALDPGLEIGAVIEVEAADEVLVRLAVARVLGDDQTRDGLEQLALAGDRPKPEIRRTDSPLGCGRRRCR